MWGNVTQSLDCACHPSLMYMLTCIGLVSTVWKFLLWFLFCELRKSQKLDTQNFWYSKFLVLYKFIQLHVSIAEWSLLCCSGCHLSQHWGVNIDFTVLCPVARLQCPILVGLCLEQCHRQQSQQLIKKSAGSLPLKALASLPQVYIQLTQENRTALLAAISNVFTFTLLIVYRNLYFNILLI